MVLARNREGKRFAISDKLATDNVGLQALNQLDQKLKNADKKQRYFAVIGLLHNLKKERRLWRLHDGSLVED